MPASFGNTDPRFKVGAYISDGTELYYVLGTETQRARIIGGAAHVTLSCEKCRTEEVVQLEFARVRDCKLVRHAGVRVTA